MKRIDETTKQSKGKILLTVLLIAAAMFGAFALGYKMSRDKSVRIEADLRLKLITAEGVIKNERKKLVVQEAKLDTLRQKYHNKKTNVILIHQDYEKDRFRVLSLSDSDNFSIFAKWVSENYNARK